MNLDFFANLNEGIALLPTFFVYSSRLRFFANGFDLTGVIGLK
ncbi:MAG: hypothetical protein QXL15_00415 [Candidatus Korarchaeota archaeon]